MGLILWWCGLASAAGLVLTEEDDGRTATASVGQSVFVRLRGNPSTGYGWFLTSAEGNSLVADGDPVFIPDASGEVGVGGTFEFRFRAAEAGPCTLSFDYRQPWDPLSSAAHFAVTVVVSASVTPPRLVIEWVEGRVELRWLTAGSDGFFLEGTSTLEPHWGVLNVLVVTEGDWYKAVLSCSSPTMFFRLRN